MHAHSLREREKETELAIALVFDGVRTTWSEGTIGRLPSIACSLNLSRGGAGERGRQKGRRRTRVISARYRPRSLPVPTSIVEDRPPSFLPPQCFNGRPTRPSARANASLDPIPVVSGLRRSPTSTRLTSNRKRLKKIGERERGATHYRIFRLRICC